MCSQAQLQVPFEWVGVLLLFAVFPPLWRCICHPVTGGQARQCAAEAEGRVLPSFTRCGNSVSAQREHLTSQTPGHERALLPLLADLVDKRAMKGDQTDQQKKWWQARQVVPCSLPEQAYSMLIMHLYKACSLPAPLRTLWAFRKSLITLHTMRYHCSKRKRSPRVRLPQRGGRCASG